MLDPTDLESEAELLAMQLRRARCCDALEPCYRCSLLRYNVLARRRVVEVPRCGLHNVSGVLGPLSPAGAARELERAC